MDFHLENLSRKHNNVIEYEYAANATVARNLLHISWARQSMVRVTIGGDKKTDLEIAAAVYGLDDSSSAFAFVNEPIGRSQRLYNKAL